jgi:hypothetical protein
MAAAISRMRSLPVGNPKIHLIEIIPYTSAAIAQPIAMIKPLAIKISS